MIGDKTVIVKLADCEFVDPNRPRWRCPYSGKVKAEKGWLCQKHAQTSTT